MTFELINADDDDDDTMLTGAEVCLIAEDLMDPIDPDDAEAVGEFLVHAEAFYKQHKRDPSPLEWAGWRRDRYAEQAEHLRKFLQVC